jgi:hypothetical protein
VTRNPALLSGILETDREWTLDGLRRNLTDEFRSHAAAVALRNVGDERDITLMVAFLGNRPPPRRSPGHVVVRLRRCAAAFSDKTAHERVAETVLPVLEVPCQPILEGGVFQHGHHVFVPACERMQLSELRHRLSMVEALVGCLAVVAVEDAHRHTPSRLIGHMQFEAVVVMLRPDPKRRAHG